MPICPPLHVQIWQHLAAGGVAAESAVRPSVAVLGRTGGDCQVACRPPVRATRPLNDVAAATKVAANAYGTTSGDEGRLDRLFQLPPLACKLSVAQAVVSL